MSKGRNSAFGLLAKIYGDAHFQVLTGYARRPNRQRKGWTRPHQGAKEAARRRAQMAAGRIPREQVLTRPTEDDRRAAA